MGSPPAFAFPDDGVPVAGKDVDRDADGLPVVGEAGDDVHCDGCAGAEVEPVHLVRGGHPDVDLVEGPGLVVAAFGENGAGAAGDVGRVHDLGA